MRKEGRTFYFLGSSITYGSATDGVSFVEEIARITGAACVKNAVCGTTLARTTGDNRQSYVERLSAFDKSAKVNTLIVQLSTNDATQGLPLGEAGTLDTNTVIGAIESIIDYAEKVWQCDVVFYTNPCFHDARYEKMIEALYGVQKTHQIGIVDFYYYRDMRPLSSDTLSAYMADAIHPNALGYKWMGAVLSARLKKKRMGDRVISESRFIRTRR